LSILRQFPVALAVGMSIFCASCEKPLHRGVSADSALQKFILPDTKVLAEINLERLKRTSFYLRHAGELPLASLQSAFGKDILALAPDLVSLQLAWNGRDVLIAGSGIQKSKLEHLAESDVAGLRFFAPDVVLVGGARAVGQAAAAARNAPGKIPEELNTPLGWLSPSDHVWLVSRGGLPFADLPLRAEYASMLANFAGYVQGTSLGLAVDDGLQLEARIHCFSERGSKRVGDALRAGIGLARLSARDSQPEDIAFFNAIEVKRDQSDVFVTAKLDAQASDRLWARLVRLGRSKIYKAPH
jgi:hypothetical protein